MAEETVDTLELVISAKATDAAEKVRSLSTSVSDFGKEIRSYIGKMGNLADVLERIADAAKGLSAIKNIQDVIGRAASAASKAKASAVGKAFQPIVPPKRPSDTVRGGTRLARTQSGGAYRYDVSADDLARQLNAKYNTTYSNKALSAEIQRIRNAQMTGGGGAQETMGLAGMIAKTAQIKGASDGLVQAMNSVFKTLDVTLEEAVYLAKQYGTSRLGEKKRKELDADYAKAKENQYRDLSDAEAERIIHGYGGLDAANAALKKAGATFQVRYGRGGAGIDSLINGTNVREIGEEAFMLRSALAGSGVDVDNPQIEDIFYALDRAQNNRHGAFMSEYGFGANVPEAQLEQMLTGDLFEQLTDMIGAGKPEDLEAPIREAKTAVENAKKEAEEAARILREENEAWKSQASWNREQDARYKDEYGGREKKWQMEADWRAYEAENAESADDPQRLREEIAGFNQIADAEDNIRGQTAEVSETSKAVADENERAAKANVYAASAAEAEAKFLEYVVKLRQQTYKAFNPKTGQFDIPVNWNGERLDKMEEAKETPKPEEAKAQVDPLAELEKKMPHIDVQDLMENATPGDILQMKLDNVRNALEKEGAKMQQDPAKIASLAEQYQRLTDKLERYKDAMREAGEAEGESSGKVGKLRGVLDALKETVGGSRLGKSMSQLFRVAKLRLFRDAVKAVTAAVKEGIGNLYQWSKMNKGHFAGAMDTMASKFMLIKNSVATAVAPLIESFVPVIAQVAQWVNQASNALAQFFAMLTGQNSWTMATESAEEWAAATATGAGNTQQAAKEAKDLLADWDELNIIQQEANDATGGGSGRKGKKPPNYKDMFEEVSTFDEWTSKFEQIKTIVLAIGAGIVAWSATEAIGGFLTNLGLASKKLNGVLSRVKRGIVGGVLLTVSFELGEMAGKELAENGLTWKGLAEEIGSLVTGGLGGYMVAKALGISPTAGVVIGIGISLVGTVISYINEKASLEDALKWGSGSMTQEEIDELLKSQFSFDVTAEIKILDSVIENESQARNNLNQKIADFKASLSTAEIAVGLAVDKSEEAPTVTKAVSDAKDAIKAVQKLIDESKTSLTAMLKILPPESTGKDEQDLLAGIAIADTTLKEYFQGIGEKMARYMYAGQKSGWKNGEMDAVLELLASQQRIYDRAAELKGNQGVLIKAKAETASVSKNGVINRDTAKSVIESQTEQLNNYEAELRQAQEETAAGYIDLWSVAQSAAEEARANGDEAKAAELEESANTYKELATGIFDKINDTVEKKMAETKATIAGYWADVLSTVYGKDFGGEFSASMTDITYSLFGITASDSNNLSEKIKGLMDKGSSAEEIGQFIKQYYTDLIKENDPSGIIKNAIESFGLTGLDVMGDEYRTQLMKYLIDSTGDEGLATEIFKKAFGLDSFEDIEKYLPETQKEARDVAQEVADGLYASASDAFARSNWNDLSDEGFHSFLKALIDKFGPEEVRDALSDMDIPETDIGPELSESVKFESVEDAFDKTDWQHMADNEFDAFLTELKDKFGGDAVSNMLKNLDIPEADIRIPLGVEVDQTDALQDWWDTYRNYMEGNYELWGGDTGAGYEEEQEKRKVLLDKLGITEDKFVEVLNKFLEHNANDPFGEEDLPDWLFGWTDEPSPEGATISGGGGNPGTAWFNGPQDESFEMDATGSGLATESSLDNLKGVNTTGFTSVEDILKALNKTMGDVNDNTRRVAEKDFSVNVYPTSGWGGFNQRSGEKREAVTGGP